uniref:ACYPI008934 protein n=1 Tax=Acyrthosiphon pisum TaxID=7029 RepID=C4WTN4_ACYPI|nr:ACYPI008934 [Acyrthosiphon pisum]
MGFKQFITNHWRLVNSNNLFINRCANSVLESHTIGYAQKSVVNKLQLPLKPKKPSPPFFQYLKERRQEVIEKHNLNFKDAVRFLSESWKDFDDNTKKKMTDIYNKELEQYKDSMKVFNESLTVDQKNELFRVKYEQIEQRTKRKLKKELKELGKPRKPLTAYLKFVTEEIKNHGNGPVQTYMVTVVYKWKELDENRKTKFFELGVLDNDNFKNALFKWENDMIKARRLDLVRGCAFFNDGTDNSN